MIRHRRAVAAATVFAAGGLAFAGCAGGGGGADGEVELEFWTITANEQNTAALDEIIADFEADNPGITVNVTRRDGDALKESLSQAAGTPAAPDLYYQYTGLGLGGEFVNQGISLNLDEYYEEYGWDDRFSASSLAAVTQYGGHHGVPFSTNIEGIVYNKAMFEDAGVTSAPTTYDELVDAAAALTAAGHTPFAFGGTANWHLMRLLDNIIETECGAETADALTALEADWASEPCVTASFTELKTWVDDYVASGWESENAEQAQAQFYQGEVAMALEGDWFGAMLKDAGFDAANLGTFPFPTGTGRIYSLQVATYVSATSEHPDEAAAFLDYWESEQVQSEYSTFSSIPVVDGVEATDNGSGITQSFVDMSNEATGTFQNNDQTFPLDVTTEYWRIQNAVATGTLDPADAGAEFQRFVDGR